MTTEGFQHRGRLIYALKYELEGEHGSSELIVWLTPEGHCQLPEVVAESGKPIVTTKPGEYISYFGERRKVVAVEVWRATDIA